jgi:5-aminolevulinate synthase
MPGRPLPNEVEMIASGYGRPAMVQRRAILRETLDDARRCQEISDALMVEHAIYLQPINYPTVPRGTERLRITPSPVHDDGEFDRLIEALNAVWARYELPRSA